MTFAVAAAVVGFAALFLIYGRPLISPPIRSDGTGYYLYLPAAIIDHDLTLRRTLARSFGGQAPDWAGITRDPNTHRDVIKYPIGEAVLLTPFFLTAHAVALSTGAPADGFSPPYQAAAAIAAVCYVAIGLWVLWGVLARSFQPSVVVWSLVAMLLGTNLFHYATYDGIFSHAFSFFLFAVFLTCTARWHDRPGIGTTVALAAAAGLVTLVRPTNSILFVYALFYGADDPVRWRARMRERLSDGTLVACAIVTFLVVVFPQLAYWQYTTGHWVIYSYVGETFDFVRPQIVSVLFSARKGLFVWAPVLVFAVAGFARLPRHARAWTVPTLVFVPINLWIISSWHDWAYGGSFGHRAFTESAAIFALGYASLLQSASARTRRVLLVLSTILIGACLRLMWAYWIGAIPIDHATWTEYLAALSVGAR